MPAFKNILKKSLYILPALAFILVLPALFSQSNSQAQGEVLGAFSENPLINGSSADLQNNVASDLQLVAPIILGPVINTPDSNTKVEITKTGTGVLEAEAKAVLVYDLASKTALVSQNTQKRLPIASLTKLMTAIVALEDAGFNKPIVITPEDKLQTLPLLGLKVGDEVLPMDLVKAMLVGSANDAAWALANHLPSRDIFIAKMNAKANALGLRNTSYANPIGFDEENNFSTAEDLRKLLNYALNKLPYEIIWKSTNFSFISILGTSYSIKNSNDLVFKYPNIKSIKTGLTVGALQNMISEVHDYRGNEIITIILGAQDRNAETLKAVDYVFGNFTWR